MLIYSQGHNISLYNCNRNCFQVSQMKISNLNNLTLYIHTSTPSVLLSIHPNFTPKHYICIYKHQQTLNIPVIILGCPNKCSIFRKNVRTKLHPKQEDEENNEKEKWSKHNMSPALVVRHN